MLEANCLLEGIPITIKGCNTVHEDHKNQGEGTI